MANFHPEVDLLTEYVAGSLPLAQAACVSVHIQHCEHCQQLSSQLSEVGAALFGSLKPAEVGDDVLNSVLARLDEAPPLSYAKTEDTSSTAPAILQRLMSGDFSDLSWKKSEWERSPNEKQAHFIFNPDHNILACLKPKVTDHLWNEQNE